MAQVSVDFDAATQSLSALNAAAYRLVGAATCQIDKSGSRFVCHLTSTSPIEPDILRSRFIELVTDENVRDGLHAKTEPVRNLILALAFGSLARPHDTP